MFYPNSCSNLTPPLNATPYLQAIDSDEDSDSFLAAFGRALVTVFSVALEASSTPISKASLLDAFESQGESIDRTGISGDVLRALDEIHNHDNIHFMAVVVSTVAAINSVGH